MIAYLFVAWLYLTLHAGIGSTLADPPASCTTDTECGCTDDCLE